MFAYLKKLKKQDDGSVFVEALLTVPIVVLAISIAVEITFAMFQVNIAAKAMQLAARRVIVSTPFTPDFDEQLTVPLSSDPTDSDREGGVIPVDATVTSSCGAGTGQACIPEAIDYLVGPHPAGNVWPGLAGFYFPLDRDTIRVTYQQNGLGFFGRPNGPVVTARLEFDNAIFINLPVTGIFFNLFDIQLPPFVVTATTEDLRNCPFTIGNTDITCDW